VEPVKKVNAKAAAPATSGKSEVAGADTPSAVESAVVIATPPKVETAAVAPEAPSIVAIADVHEISATAESTVASEAPAAVESAIASETPAKIEVVKEPKSPAKLVNKVVAINENSVSQANASNEPYLENAVHEGEDGWLFLVSGSNNVLDLYKNESSFTSEMADDWVELLQERSSKFEEMGIQYLHLPAPEKLTVMNQHYQGTLENVEGSPLLQMAAKHAAKVPCMVNVVPYFKKQPEQTRLYWKTDTHWSFWGCYSAYQLLCGRIGVEPHSAMLNYPYNEIDCMFDLGSKLDEPRKEMARFYQLAQNAKRSYANPIVRFKEEQNLADEGHIHVGSHVTYKNTAEHAIDKCVMLFGDSFSECREHLLTGMLAETFREVHFIWNPNIDYEYVNFIQPDIVITELAERFMTRVPDDKLDIQSFAAERLADYKIKAINGDPSMGFALPESVILEEVIMPSETYHLDPPHVVQADCVNVDNDPVMKTHPVKLIDVENAKVFFNGGRCMVRAPGGEILVRYRVSNDDCNELPWKQYRRVEGTVMLFGNSMGAHCYYHWMLDLLPKLGMLEKAGIALSSIDYFLVREMNASFHKETLERLGIDSSRIIETKDDSYLQCDRLISLEVNNGINMKMNRFIPNWMKHLYPPEYPIGERIKLYISRPKGVRRGIANEEELIPFLEEAGYVVSAMEGMSVAEQAQLLARADVLISPHGGALTNMVFCRPGIQVVELFGRHVYPFYYGLAQMCGHDYHAILENPEDYPRLIQFREAQKVGSVDFQKHTRENSFDVDVDHFKAMLKSVG